MFSKLQRDPRIDPRIKAVFGEFGLPPMPDVTSREALIAEETSPEAQAGLEAVEAFYASTGADEVHVPDGLETSTLRFASEPDGNEVQILFMRPKGAAVRPCVYYIHGGGMSALSCFDANYQVWGRTIAAQDVAVAMVDFRNAVHPSSAAETAPYPAGLNDCVAGLRWLHSHAAELQIDPGRIVVAGDSGGGNLTLATALKLRREGDVHLLAGVYALCPYIAGMWPDLRYPSTIENDGIFLSINGNRAAMGYGIEAYDVRDPLAWPAFATIEDVRGLPPVVISVNECDPLRDEGVAFYRLLLAAGVNARCRQVMGTVHATEVFPAICPDISRDTARSIAALAMEG